MKTDDDDSTSLVDVPQPTRFSDLMTTIASGDFDVEVTKDLADLIDGCANEKSGVTGGVITITLTIKAGERKVLISPKHSVKVKRRGVDSDDFFVDRNGRLVKDDPRQTNMKFVPGKSSKPAIDVTKKQPPKGGDKEG